MKESMLRMVVVTILLLALMAEVGSFRVKFSDMDPDFYCTGRNINEFFRKEMDVDTQEEEVRGTCSTYYRCIPGPRKTMQVTKHKCGRATYFDVEKQVCRMKLDVENCAQWEKLQKPKPKWPPVDGEKSSCQLGEIECGSGECLDKALFCDTIADCVDGSDENICSNAETDPNAAERCNPNECKASEGCLCSPDGTRVPWGLEVSKVPQMITISFSGAVTGKSYDIYRKLFNPLLKNKGNGCSVKATFFVNHGFTNYSAVQELHRLGHEIAVGSITNTPDNEYWDKLIPEDFADEFDGGRTIIEKFANISQQEILGMRLPSGRIGGNRQFTMMQEWGFLYDSSIAAPRGSSPIWPYTLQYRMPHKCLGIDQQCPTRNYTVWEVVINELDRRDDPLFEEQLTGCHYIDQCSTILHPRQFRDFLENNLQHHYRTNRAPLGLHFSASYFHTRPRLLRELIQWIDDVSNRGDFYFVTMNQAVTWMEFPTELTAMNNFNEWKLKCVPEGVPYCQLPKPCESSPPRQLYEEGNMYLHTCQECPRKYPWLHNPEGIGETLFDYVD